jgi:hypothetical protein
MSTTQVVKTLSNGVTAVKQGFKTTEFWLSTFVVAASGITQFLPAAEANDTVKVVAVVAGLLSALGYTASRTVAKL